MRRTSAAVALLLTLGAVEARRGIALNASFNGSFTDSTGFDGIRWDWGYSACNSNPCTYTANTSNYNDVKGRSCVNCIRNYNIWCSRIWLGEKTANDWVNPGNPDSSNGKPALQSFSSTASTLQDLGQCCFSYHEFMIPSGTATGESLNNVANKYTCAAAISNLQTKLNWIKDGSTDKSAAVVLTAATAMVTNKNWWCSSGQYKINSGSGTGTNKPVAKDRFETDARMEFMLMACRQRQDICGVATIEAITAIGSRNATKHDRLVVKSKMTFAEKCTWIHKSKLGAPTFQVVKDSTNAIPTAKWDLHYAEFNTSTLKPAVTIAGSGVTNAGGADNLPLPHFSWAKLMARQYDTAGTAGIVQTPNVWQPIDPAKFYTDTDALYMKKRWFPPALALKQITAYKARTTQYTGTDYPAYDTKRKAWDAAITAGAKKADFFATLFNPPKKTAPPARPNQPTRPEAYTGMYQQPFSGFTKSKDYTRAKGLLQTKDTLAEYKLTGNQFIVDGGQGGWGSFTVGLLTIKENAYKSFGVYGWQLTTGKDFSFVDDWTQMCLALVSSVQNGYCPKAKDAVALDPTTIEQILIVSMWANDKSAEAFGVKISFDINKWAQNATAWALPARPAAGVAPKEQLGAKMLAASTAAAAAVAAALY